MPQGRLLLFWGCGEHAGPGQPVVIDFSKLARGQIPPGLYASSVDLPEAWSINSGNSTTFGEWPNTRDSKTVPANSSLLGAHRIAGNYSPEINFTLNDDFMFVSFWVLGAGCWVLAISPVSVFCTCRASARSRDRPGGGWRSFDPSEHNHLVDSVQATARSTLAAACYRVPACAEMTKCEADRAINPRPASAIAGLGRGRHPKSGSASASPSGLHPGRVPCGT